MVNSRTDIKKSKLQAGISLAHSRARICGHHMPSVSEFGEILPERKHPRLPSVPLGRKSITC